MYKGQNRMLKGPRKPAIGKKKAVKKTKPAKGK